MSYFWACLAVLPLAVIVYFSGGPLLALALLIFALAICLVLALGFLEDEAEKPGKVAGGESDQGLRES